MTVVIAPRELNQETIELALRIMTFVRDNGTGTIYLNFADRRIQSSKWEAYKRESVQCDTVGQTE